MGYYLTADPEPPTRERVEYLMRRAGERFHAEFGGVDIELELDFDARTVRAWCDGDSRTYSFDSLL